VKQAAHVRVKTPSVTHCAARNTSSRRKSGPSSTSTITTSSPPLLPKALESKVVEAIIIDEWRLTRARLVENQIFCRGYMSAKQEDQFISGAETWLAHSKELATLTLYEQGINRVLARNKAEFASLQAARHGAGVLACALPTTASQQPEVPPAIAEAPESKTGTAAPDQPAGFVHSSDVPTPTTDPQVSDPNPKSSRWLRSFEKRLVPGSDFFAPVESSSTPPETARYAA
jgi:hypothetical protein